MRVGFAKRRAVALCMLLGAGGSAFGASLSVSVQAGFSSDSANGSSALERSVSGSGIGGFGTVSAFARADFGSMGVSTSGSAPRGPQVSGPTIVSRAEATFQDILFIGGPAGTPVELTFTLDLEGTCSALPDASLASCYAAGSVALPGAGVSVNADGARTTTATIAWVGDSAMGINGDMLAMGSAIDGSYEAAFADTLHLYVSSATPGVVITSESGHDYSPPVSAVPEPPIAALLAGGALVVAWARRRQASG
jgi:hypothetical protein